MHIQEHHTLVGTRSFDENGFIIKYYRTQNETEHGSAYGVCLKKYNGTELTESLSIALTNELVHINGIIDRLIAGAVTVVGLPEVVDYLYDEAL